MLVQLLRLSTHSLFVWMTVELGFVLSVCATFVCYAYFINCCGVRNAAVFFTFGEMAIKWFLYLVVYRYRCLLSIYY